MSRQRAYLYSLLILICASIAMADDADTSRYSKQIYRNYPEARTPESQPVFLWDFSGSKEYPYHLHMESEMAMHSNFGPQTQTLQEDKPFRFNAEGTITVRSKQNHTADLVFKQFASDMQTDGTPGMRMEQPPTVIQGMKEDGTMEIGQSSTELLLKTLFPLPSRVLTPGEAVEIPLLMPFNANGSVLNVKGHNRIKLNRYVTIENRTCAELESEFIVADLDVPAELKGKYECSFHGNAIFYFDVAARSFHSGRVALLIQMNMESPSPKMDLPADSTDNFHLPDTTQMSMRTDQYMEITRETTTP